MLKHLLERKSVGRLFEASSSLRNSPTAGSMGALVCAPSVLNHVRRLLRWTLSFASGIPTVAESKHRMGKTRTSGQVVEESSVKVEGRSWSVRCRVL